MALPKDEILERLEDIDESFLDAIEEDDRLRSGVPELQRATDLDFIRMTGIAREASDKEGSLPVEAALSEPDERADMLSFFERGVADVDAAMAPPALEQTEELNKEIVFSRPPQSGLSPAAPLIADFKEVIGELVREESMPDADAGEIEPTVSRFMPPGDAEPEVVFEASLVGDVSPAGGNARERALDDFADVRDADLSPEIVRDVLRAKTAAGLDEPPSDIPEWIRPDEISSSEGFSLAAELEDEDSLLPPLDPEDRENSPPSRPVLREVLPPPGLLHEEPLSAVEPENEETPLPIEPAVRPPASRPVSPGFAPMADLAEAEHLLQALESQPRDRVPSEFPPRAVPSRTVPVESASPRTPASEARIETAPPQPEPLLQEVAPKAEDRDAAEERDASIYRRPSAKHRRRRSNRRSRGWRRLVRWGTTVAILVAIAGAGVVGYTQFGAMFATPEQSFERADALQHEGKYADAAEAYRRFAKANPDHPRHADAQFNAAFCMQLAPADSFDAKQAVNARAVELFDQFVKDNPAHGKVPRAKVRMGILDFEMGRYDAAVELLQDPALPQSDPQGALPALRALARARWKLGQLDEAASAYLQAASVMDNCTADHDYDELGDLYRWRAERTDNADEKKRFQTGAVENWNMVLRMPTADPSARGKIREKRKWVCEQLGITDEAGQALVYQPEGKNAPATPASAPAPVVEQSAVPPAAEAETSSATAAAPDPGAEATYPGAAPGGAQ